MPVLKISTLLGGLVMGNGFGISLLVIVMLVLGSALLSSPIPTLAQTGSSTSTENSSTSATVLTSSTNSTSSTLSTAKSTASSRVASRVTITLNATLAQVGANVSVFASGFSAADTTCSLSGGAVGSSACTISNSTLTASFVVANVAGGLYTIVATGSPGADSAAANLIVLASAPSITLNPTTAQVGWTVHVSGSGFRVYDTTCTISGSAVNNQTCSISVGALIGSFIVNNMPAGSYTITVTGSLGGDSASATLTISVPVAPTSSAVIQNNSSYVDISGDYHIVGEVKNTGDVWLQSILVSATLKDQNGATVDVKQGSPWLQHLPPQGAVGFDVTEPDVAKSAMIRSYTLTLTYQIGQPKAVLLKIDSLTSTKNSLGWIQIQGEVMNVGNSASDNTTVSGTFYGSDGKVVFVTFTTPNDVTIQPGASETFTLTIVDSGRSSLVSRYSVAAESNEYTSILPYTAVPEFSWQSTIMAWVALALGITMIRKKTLHSLS